MRLVRLSAYASRARVLAVLVNSLYSFWWDVTNDWGLSLLTKNGWSSNQNAYEIGRAHV